LMRCGAAWQRDRQAGRKRGSDAIEGKETLS